MEITFVIIWCTLSLSVALITLFSLLPGKSWVLRVCDFPRSQMLVLGIALLAALGITLAITAPPAEPLRLVVSILSVILLASVVVQAWWAYRFVKLKTHSVPSSRLRPDCFHKSHPEIPVENALRIITANVDYTNANPTRAIEQLLHWHPHILTLVETDERWDEIIEGCRESLPFIIKELRGEGRGMAVLSRIPIEHAQVKCLVDDDRPSIWAQLCMPDAPRIHLVVTHPAPPGLPKRNTSERHSSKKRDIELDLIASHIGQRPDQHWIVSGDFNDVGWSATTMRAKRIGGLRDPRIGRGMYNTYPASLPLLRYPIDHVMVSKSFELVHLTRLKDIGSDHLPLLADLELVAQRPQPPAAGNQEHADALIYSSCNKTTRGVERHRPSERASDMR